MSWIALIALLALAGYSLNRKPATETSYEPKRELLLVCLLQQGDQPLMMLDWAAEHLAEEFGELFSIRAKPVYIPREAFHRRSGQANAVKLLEVVERLVLRERAVLALTEYDLYSPLRRDLTFAMGARKGWAGLLSTYRMVDSIEPANTRLRLRKMLSRYAAEIVCDASRNSDPESLLYEALERPEELDIMHFPNRDFPSSS